MNETEKTSTPVSARKTLRNFHGKIEPLLSMKLLAFALIGVTGIYFTLDAASTVPSSVFSQISKLTKSNPQQPASMSVPAQEKAVLPVVLPADAEEPVKLQVPSAATTKQPISEGSIDVPTIPLLPQPLAQSGRVDYGRILERVQQRTNVKPIPLIEQVGAATEDDGTGVHVELRNAKKQSEGAVAAENDAVKVKIDTKKTDDNEVASAGKNNSTTIVVKPAADVVSLPEYQVLQKNESGVLIRQGNKVNLIRFGDKLPDGSQAKEEKVGE